ncbi:MAG: peroxisomal assembly protein [Bogoriella megaspora]|nr:MAG: peroxisomal assembly protein [Bogoriella megaspora]
MALDGRVVSHRKRRRRRQDKPAISAHLLLDERLTGDIGTVSEDLFSDLFPGLNNLSEHADDTRTLHVAITPWMPASLSAVTAISWTILSVRKHDSKTSARELAHSSILFPASSLALQSFKHTLESLSPHRTRRLDAPIEIRVLDVVPLPLDAVFVSLDTDALQKLEDVHNKFGGGFGGGSRGQRSNGKFHGNEISPDSPEGGKRKKGIIPTKAQQKRWTSATREALAGPRIVHAGDLLPFPLPSHPITHVPPPPAKITACEPVSQGIVVPSTRVVIVQSNSHQKIPLFAEQPGQRPESVGVAENNDNADDTSNEQFFSAVEDRSGWQSTTPPDEDDTSNLFDTGHSETENSELSEDEDMISLNAPGLPPSTSGVMSSMTAATPRALGGLTNGAATPGSVLSGFTATTMRGPPGSRSRVFQAHGMLERLTDELLHPRPSGEDDDEARVYIDVATLAKLGCFSGDWVKIAATAEPQMSGLGLWGLGNADHDSERHDWRAVKIFGIPEGIAGKTPKYTVNNSHERRSSLSYMLPTATTSHAYMSPILLENMGDPTHLKISALQNDNMARKVPASASPPSPKEVTLLKMLTPLATDRQLQPSLFASLKSHFESRRRLVKEGDLIAITIDERLGRAVFESSSAEDDMGYSDLLATRKSAAEDEDVVSPQRKHTAVAWFRVANIRFSDPSIGDSESKELWGGIAVMDPHNTSMRQSGTEQGNVPAILDSTWPFYLGTKALPASTGVQNLKTTALKEPPKSYVSAMRRRLRELIGAATQARAVHLGLPPMAILLTSNQRNIGKATLATQACEDLGIHTFVIDAYDVLSEGGAGGGDVKTEGLLKARAERALTCGSQYTVLLLRHVDALNADRMVTALREILDDSRVLVATSCEVNKIPDGIRAIFTHELEVNAPDEAEREGILRNIAATKGISLAPEVDLSSVAVKTAALVAGDLVDVVERAVVAQQQRLEKLASSSISDSGNSNSDKVTVRDILISGGSSTASLIPDDLTIAVDAARKNFADSIGAPKIPTVSWADVGGLSHVINSILETIQLPLTHPSLFSRGLKKRSGILFYGPPGTGKTLLAKAIATEFSLNFFSVKGPELLNMYIGESEANVRRVFQRARDARPCVVFFDELDSVAPKRGNQGDSGGVMDRIVSQLLAELDGMSGGEGDEGGGKGTKGAGGGGQGVFVIGATNRPDLLDQALLRPGRFDKMLYLGVSDTHAKQEKILEALTRKFALDASLSLSRIAETLPFTYTGADLYALCSDAMLKAITRQARAVDVKIEALNTNPEHLHAELLKSAEAKGKPKHDVRGPPGKVTTAWFFDHLASKEDTDVVVIEEDFAAAQKDLVPSVSAEELKHYDRVRRTFEGQEKEKDKVNGPRPSIQANGVAKGSVPSKPDLFASPLTTHAILKRKPATGRLKGKSKATVEYLDGDADEEILDGGLGEREQDSDDDYIIRTDAPVGKGKGKATTRPGFQGRFGDAMEGDGDLYS